MSTRVGTICRAAYRCCSRRSRSGPMAWSHSKRITLAVVNSDPSYLLKHVWLDSHRSTARSQSRSTKPFGRIAAGGHRPPPPSGAAEGLDAGCSSASGATCTALAIYPTSAYPGPVRDSRIVAPRAMRPTAVHLPLGPWLASNLPTVYTFVSNYFHPLDSRIRSARGHGIACRAARWTHIRAPRASESC